MKEDQLLYVVEQAQWFVPMMDPKYYIIGNKNHEILSDISLSFGNLYWVHFRFAERSVLMCIAIFFIILISIICLRLAGEEIHRKRCFQ